MITCFAVIVVRFYRTTMILIKKIISFIFLLWLYRKYLYVGTLLQINCRSGH